MDSFSIGNLEALQNLIAPEQEDDGHVFGSALNPSSLHGKNKSELAAPNAKVEVKTFNRDAKGGAPEASIQAAKEETKM